MRDRRARAALVGLTLLFPVLMTAASPRAEWNAQTLLAILGAQAVLIGGFLTVMRERQVLQGGTQPIPARQARRAPSLPHVRPVTATSARVPR